MNAKRDAMRCDEMSKMANGRKSTNKEAKANKQIQNGMSKGARRGVLRGGWGEVGDLHSCLSRGMWQEKCVWRKQSAHNNNTQHATPKSTGQIEG